VCRPVDLGLPGDVSDSITVTEGLEPVYGCATGHAGPRPPVGPGEGWRPRGGAGVASGRGRHPGSG
jgi:hypothetical protein